MDMLVRRLLNPHDKTCCTSMKLYWIDCNRHLILGFCRVVGLTFRAARLNNSPWSHCYDATGHICSAKAGGKAKQGVGGCRCCFCFQPSTDSQHDRLETRPMTNCLLLILDTEFCINRCQTDQLLPRTDQAVFFFLIYFA